MNIFYCKKTVEMKILKNILFIKQSIIWIIAGVFLLSGQIIFSQEINDSIMFKAMKDELGRNMENLKYNDNQPPFYISYDIDDVKTIYISASLGALNNKSDKHYCTWSNRVLMGDYKLNDENFYDVTRKKSPRDGDLELPLDNDYYGIRRALWMMTNNTYKSAAENFKNKLAALKEKNLSEKDLQIPDFSTVPVVTMNIPDKKMQCDKDYLESLVKEASLVFKAYPEIFYSEAAVYQIHTNVYFYSSEKSQIKAPVDILYLSVTAICQSKDGDNMGDQIRYCSKDISGLPNIDTIKADIRYLAQNMVLKSKAPILEENYAGPVLFSGQAVAEIFSQGLFNGKDNLYAYREPLYNNSQMSMYYGQNINSLELKLNKQVISKNITIKDFSKLKEYKGSELFGSYYADGEGVVPNDTLLLVENGILKNLYNGRTPTRNICCSNGHKRFILKNGNITYDLGPGVLLISATDGQPLGKLKENLIKSAKEDGLDYAIIIKPIKQCGYYMPLNIYKVSVSDGKEELLREASMKLININSLKKVAGISSNTFLYNTLMNAETESEEDDSNVFEAQGLIPSGIPASFIVPDGLLLKDIEFEHQTKPLSSERPIVKSPLMK